MFIVGIMDPRKACSRIEAIKLTKMIIPNASICVFTYLISWLFMMGKSVQLCHF